jgi:hydrogenase small subunit
MFFHLGCKGPTTNTACNKYLWNEVNSKTRAGVPCFGCARPDFPQEYSFFETPNIVNTPIELPKGVDRAHYLAYKDMAAAAAPKRLKDRTQKV